jgi:hypothetical protein
MKRILTAGPLAIMLAFGSNSSTAEAQPITFRDDVAFLKKHTEVIVLADKEQRSLLAVVPAWQGRAMTSSADGQNGQSFGWINRELISSGKILPHINVFGGEDRFWLGPEGGQYSIFFAKGAKFELADWQTPAAIDTMPYRVVTRKSDSVSFAADFMLTNYSGTVFNVKVDREVRLLPSSAAWKHLKLSPGKANVVAFESDNRITNIGKDAWTKEKGLLSIWILGMFNPSPAATIVVPLNAGPESKFGPKVTSDYFGEVPKDRLVVKDDVLFFSADGQYRSKIGISPKRSKAVLGSYDADNKVLTIVQFTQPRGAVDYVNSLWKLQDNPYGGDASNAYNDGPPSPGAKPLGPFYELESSSPAASLKPGRNLSHVHRTIHLAGAESELDGIAQKVLGVSLNEVKNAFKQK